MNRRNIVQRPTNRIETGKAVLDAAQVIDTSLVATRLANFAAIHQAYVDAQSVVDTAQNDLSTAMARVTAADTALDAAIDDLVFPLMYDRRQRRNAFAPFGVDAPSVVIHMNPAEKAKTIITLVAAIKNDAELSASSQEAAAAAEVAALALQSALEPGGAIDAALRKARSNRDALADQWDDALKMLRRGARVAADEGASDLFAILFGRTERGHKRTKTAPEAATKSDDSDTVAA